MLDYKSRRLRVYFRWKHNIILRNTFFFFFFDQDVLNVQLKNTRNALTELFRSEIKNTLKPIITIL